MEFKDLSVFELVEGVKSRKFTCEEIVKYFISQCDKKKDLNAVIEVFDDVLERAREIDERVSKGESVGKLAGVPVAIKDNILAKGKKMSCASNFLKDFVAPYTATLVNNLEAEDAIIFARTNMDEFAMGGSCENTIYGACKNAHNSAMVSGGSSGGSAVVVAAGMCPVAIGTDTGGSVRQPSSFNGVVGIKPTYGTVSRFGIVAFGSSVDQASPITKTVEENEYVLSIMAGKDVNDGTSIDNKFDNCAVKDKYTIGIVKQMKDKLSTLETYPQFEKAIENLKAMGYQIIDVDVPHILDILACYYILTPAEATSNLARFDGVKYTTRNADAKTLEEVYVLSRSEGFGREVKKRIMIGNFVLSSGYFDAYYNKAKKLQALIKKEFADAFKVCDAIITPTTPGETFEIGGKISDPVAMYLEDLFTVPASIAGVPALSVPYAVGKLGLPLGLQFIGAERSEHMLYDIAKKYVQNIKEGK